MSRRRRATLNPADLTPLDRNLLDAVQAGIPLVERPFAAIAQTIGTDEAGVLDRLGVLKRERRIVRQISAIFDTPALGYRSALVAAQYADDAIDAAAAVIGAHPGVSHNYRRSHAFNLWYTVAVPPTSRLGLDGTIERLHALSGARVTRPMPTLRRLKIGVRLPMGEAAERASSPAPPRHDADADDVAAPDAPPTTPLDASDIAAIRALQEDLALVSRPFDAPASAAGLSTTALLTTAARLLRDGRMRRFAAVLRTHEAGFTHNCMGVWNVPDDRVDEVAAVMVRCDAVSHCYERPRYPEWPYNVFTMVHGRSEAQCRETLAELAAETGVRERGELWSVHEYKKTRVRYFTPEIDAWEARFG